ncbi:MAG TPA: hypothetical protein PLY25_12105, partial [Bacteroidia bacterium]|nr:hypothetical protein [Bacteroidia bacterium]
MILAVAVGAVNEYDVLLVPEIENPLIVIVFPLPTVALLNEPVVGVPSKLIMSVFTVELKTADPEMFAVVV